MRCVIEGRKNEGRKERKEGTARRRSAAVGVMIDDSFVANRVALGCDYSQQITDIFINRRTVGNIFVQTVSYVNSFVKSDFFHLPHKYTDTPIQFAKFNIILNKI